MKQRPINNEIKVYGLIDPTNSQLFYIGLTARELNSRLSQHINDSSLYVKGNRSKKRLLLDMLKASNIKPEILLIDVVPYEKASFFEEFYICLYRSYGFDLLQKNISTYNRCYL